MDYVCLAAGKGSRFGELGRYLQKAMYPVGLTPFLELSIRNLLRSRATDPRRDRLTLLVGHHGEQIRAYFGARYGALPIRYLQQGKAGGTGHALRVLHDALRPTVPVVAWLADLYVPAHAFEAVARHPDANVLTLAPAGDDDNLSVRVSLDDGRVTRAWYGDGPLADIGLWKLEPRVMADMTEATGHEVRALPNVQRAIQSGVRVGVLEVAEWVHLGGVQPTPEANVRDVVRRIHALEDAGAAEPS
jgi:NDP-sugar pyrophosphorylase family protein